MSALPIPTSPAPEGKRRPYDAYQHADFKWLEMLPKNWDAVPLKRLTTFVSRGDSPDYVEESSIPVVNQGCIYWNGLRLDNVRYQAETQVSAWKGLLRQGDVLINATGTGTLGRAAIFNQVGRYIADSHVVIVRTNGRLYGPYLFYLLQTPLYQSYIYAALVAGSTNQIELSREGLRAMPIILPSSPEQRIIAAFLDRETARIDALISKRQQLISLLGKNVPL